MIGLSSRICIEEREDGNLLAAWKRIDGIVFPVGMFDAAEGKAELVVFHRELGEALAKMTEEQRSRAYVSVQVDDDGYPFHVFGAYRVETEEEYAGRIAQEKTEKARYEADSLVRRRELYEKLKLEFEPISAD